jgi:hypothetical protein
MTRFAQMGVIHHFEPPGPVIKIRERAEAFIAEAHGQRKGAANASYCSNNLVKSLEPQRQASFQHGQLRTS